MPAKRRRELRLPEWLACVGIALAAYWPWEPMSSTQLILVAMCAAPLGVRTLLRWEEFATGSAAAGDDQSSGQTRADLDTYLSSFERALVGLAILQDAPGGAVVQQCNKALREMLDGDATGHRWTSLVSVADRVPVHTALAALAQGDLAAWRGEIEHLCIDEPQPDRETPTGPRTRWLQVSLVPLPRRDDEPLRISLQAIDVTARREEEQRLRRLALHDDLTGLPNRGLLSDRLTVALGAAARTRRTVAVLFCDLDDFKRVNDTIGHAAGDVVLVETARRLLEAVRPSDTVARLGGDEFVVVCPDLPDDLTAHLVADRISQAIAEPYVLPGPSETAPSEAPGRSELSRLPELPGSAEEKAAALHRIGVSIGIVTSRPGVCAAQLLAAADAAMYSVKRARRGQITGDTPDSFASDAHAGSDLAATG